MQHSHACDRTKEVENLVYLTKHVVIFTYSSSLPRVKSMAFHKISTKLKQLVMQFEASVFLKTILVVV